MLYPVEGTPFEEHKNLTPAHCLKILCLFRFLHPKTEIRAAGGREKNLRSLQPLALYVADFQPIKCLADVTTIDSQEDFGSGVV